MNNDNYRRRLTGAVICLALAPGLANAYIDVGSGAYMVQALFTLVGAGLFYIRHPIKALQAMRRRLFGSNVDADSSSESEETGSKTV